MAELWHKLANLWDQNAVLRDENVVLYEENGAESRDKSALRLGRSALRRENDWSSEENKKWDESYRGLDFRITTLGTGGMSQEQEMEAGTGGQETSYLHNHYARLGDLFSSLGREFLPNATAHNTLDDSPQAGSSTASPEDHMGGRDALSHQNQASSDEPFNPDIGGEVGSYVHLTDTLQTDHLDGGQNVIVTNESPGTAAQKAMPSSDMTTTQKPQSPGHLSPTPTQQASPLVSLCSVAEESIFSTSDRASRSGSREGRAGTRAAQYRVVRKRGMLGVLVSQVFPVSFIPDFHVANYLSLLCFPYTAFADRCRC